VQLQNNNYDNFEAIVDLLDATATIAVLYFIDTSINKVSEAWAIINDANLAVVGKFGNQGPTQATFLVDFPLAVQVSTTIGVTES